MEVEHAVQMGCLRSGYILGSLGGLSFRLGQDISMRGVVGHGDSRRRVGRAVVDRRWTTAVQRVVG